MRSNDNLSKANEGIKTKKNSKRMEVPEKSVNMEATTEEKPSIDEVKVEAPMEPVEEPKTIRKERKKRKKGRKIPKGSISFLRMQNYYQFYFQGRDSPNISRIRTSSIANSCDRL